MASYLTELSKMYSVISKEYSKASHTAKSYIKHEDETFIDGWWNSFSISFDHASQDQEWLVEKINNEVSVTINRVLSEKSHLEYKLHQKGLEQISSLRESIIFYEQKVKDRDRAREKVSSSLERASQHSGAISNLTSSDSTRLVQKLHSCESILQEAVNSLVKTQVVCIYIPMIIIIQLSCSIFKITFLSIRTILFKQCPKFYRIFKLYFLVVQQV